MSSANFYLKGDWNFICDVCGRKMKSSQARLRWDGFYVCPTDWEPRQAQDFVRGRPDEQTPPWTRPVAGDQFIPVACTLQGRSAASGLAVSGCMVVGRVPPGV